MTSLTNKMQVIGALEQNVGQARIAFAVHADFPTKHFGDMSEAEWLESPTTNTARTLYPEYVKARERLELWEFLLQAAQNWQPGDNVVDTWNNNQDDAVPPGTSCQHCSRVTATRVVNGGPPGRRGRRVDRSAPRYRRRP